MATQSLEFGYTTGQTLTAKAFAIGSDTSVQTASAVAEATNRDGRYVATFTDLAAGNYMLVYFLGGAGAGSENYTVTATTATFQPWSEAAPPATEILAAIDGVDAIYVQSGITSTGTLSLVQGDTYNGTGKPLLTWTVTDDYTDGWAATLTIRDEDDAVVATAAGVVASSTSVTVSLTAPTGLTFTGTPGVWQGKFDVQMSKDTNRVTIANARVYIYEDQTRT